MKSEVKVKIVKRLADIIRDIAPDATMLDMYGGKIIELIPGKSGSRGFGYFVHANHVSLEFTKDAALQDPDQILEGTGKLRRHIKLRQLHDVGNKRCKEFLVQVTKL